MEVNIKDDYSEEIFWNLFAQLEGLSLLSEDEVVAEETTEPWNINALREPLSSQFRKRPLPSAAAGVDQLMGPEYRQDSVVYTQDQGSNKRIIYVDPTQQEDQCYIAETSQSINPTLQTGHSPSQALFTVSPESIHFTAVGSSVDTRAAQQQPKKRQRR
ncbi:unnamed protein product [Eruca vesicaria subsp. sativa]|uniref:Uncharacterized protein n=1 Tax=Eruca vesicaria subsp. sativa TaxID=29727 RepID=A0ABC8LB82_ERUVS|nr:unnamed protein product [Eruca vesicaria subsp. sativa]